MLYISKFSDDTYDAKKNAQRNLHGRNFYVTEDTLQFFGAKIRCSGTEENGFLFYIIETFPYEDSRRARPVFFDVFGDVVYRLPAEDCPKTIGSAIKLRDAFLDSFDIQEHMKNAIQSNIDFFQSNMTHIQKQMKHLEGVSA